jgi:regulator of sirC expression with transglutaminase-like and TPR domain
MQGLHGFRLASFWLIVSIAFPALSSAEPTSFPTLERLLVKPEVQIDFAQAKLTVDLLIDPKQQSTNTLLQIDDWTKRVKARLPADASRRAKLDILISTLYIPGHWNDYRPFQYDLDDPLGKSHRTKLLATYLSTRKGNCVSMPIFFIILGQKLGLPVTLATAPEHAMVKYLDDSGQWLNVEATGGGFKYDSSYEREFKISAKAIKNDIYLRPLSRKESVTVMISTLMEHYGRTNQQKRRIALAELILKFNAKDVVAMQHIGAANYLLLQEQFMRPYPDANKIPQEKRAEFKRLSAENLRWYAKAEMLGWIPTTPEQDAKYLDTIRKEKAKQQGERE